MEIRTIVNNLIDDISNGVSVSQILLKAQIIAFNLADERFSLLIKNEQQGYSPKGEIPDYRKQKSMMKATFLDAFQNSQTIEVHTEAIEDERIKNLMTYVYVKEPLVQVEEMYKNAENGMVRVQVPVFAYPTIENLYKGYNVKLYSAYQYFPKESLLSIVETFKGQLLDMLLQFDKKLDWQLDISTGKNKSMAQTIIKNVYNIHAVVANTGNGTISTDDISVE